ncbi:MAG: dTMP kinase [Chlamydiae bacterium]|nr:dTMP kinase [Chlamydiota bacterium]
MKKGYFITIEGGEGVGKSTLIASLKEKLNKFPLVFTREPGGTVFSEKVREILLTDKSFALSSMTELCLFLASRAQHLKEIIIPAVNDNKIVICDRFNDSSIAYQGYARGLGLDEVDKFSKFVCQGFEPDLTLYLDLDPEIAFSRLAHKEFDKIESEKISFHRKIREGFLILSKKYPQRIKVINAEKPIQTVVQESLNLIENLIHV